MEHDMPSYTQEELQEILEKAKRDYQAMLDKMTPEEREQAQIKAAKMLEEDQAARQKLLDDAAKLMSGTSAKEKPKFCTSCGAPAGSGAFCEYCGQPF